MRERPGRGHRGNGRAGGRGRGNRGGSGRGQRVHNLYMSQPLLLYPFDESKHIWIVIILDLVRCLLQRFTIYLWALFMLISLHVALNTNFMLSYMLNMLWQVVLNIHLVVYAEVTLNILACESGPMVLYPLQQSTSDKTSSGSPAIIFV